MPLLSSTLADALAAIGPQKTIDAAAEKWFKAWFDFASGMVLLAGATGAESSLKSSFVSTLKGGMDPANSASSFLDAWENAQKTAWLILGASPYLLPAFASTVPAPAPLAPTLTAVPALGIKSTTADPPCQAFALATYLWTITYTAIPIAGGPPVPFS